MARISGVATNLPVLIPSGCCVGDQVNPRLRARSSSENFPVGLTRIANRTASFSNLIRAQLSGVERQKRLAVGHHVGAMSAGRSRRNFWITLNVFAVQGAARATPARSPAVRPAVVRRSSVDRGASCSASRSRRRTLSRGDPDPVGDRFWP